jgi:flagellar biosynthetic protein FliR
MVTLSIPLIQIQAFLLIFLRVGAVLSSAPIFDNQSAPVVFKVGLALSISFLLYPLLNINVDGFSSSLVLFVLTAASEVAVGLLIGFAVKTLFAGIQLAGQIAGFQMGLTVANVIDPSSSMQVPILSHFFNLFAMLIFLSINAHHWFVKALTESFILVPPLEYQLNSALVPPVLTLAGNIFVVAVKVSAPILVALLLTTVALGLLARTVPQIQIFVVAMPLKIFIGLFFVTLTLPFLAGYLKDLFSGLGYLLFGLIRSMS